jgi:succinate dehydrogenase / fumarate reductase membrane anchor subunit
MIEKAAPTPVRPAGGHHKESRLWLLERITAVLLIPLSLWLALSLASLPQTSYEAFLAWIKGSMQYHLLLAFILISAQHALLGLGSILDDYVQGPLINRLSQAAVKLGLLGVVITAAAAIYLLQETN